MRSSLLWGGLASLGFFTLIHTGALSDPFFYRYFASHWVLYAETIMFFVALAQLILRAGDLADQRARLKKVAFDKILAVGNDPVFEAGVLQDQLAQLPASQRNDYLPTRLHEALEGVRRKASAAELESDLRFLSDADAGKAHSGYAMIRLIIWAIPILGFLGTVIGITIAIAGLDPKALQESLDVVTGGLGVAFDTTALALALSMGLMFLQYLVDKLEQRLLGEVDTAAIALLMPRFPSAGGEQDPNMNAVRRMADAVIGAVERCVNKQAELWGRTVETAERRWEAAASGGRDLLEESFGKALTKSIEAHRKHLLAAEESVAELNRKHWQGVQKSLEACASTSLEQQTEVRRQFESLQGIVEASSEIRRMEETLERSLGALSASQHLQETLANLTAAVHLLNSRLERLTPAASLGLHHPVSQSKAA
jgi:biopolymer transport protein ExbB/TolQ/Asp/Glu/hydantoin racemase